MKYLLDTHVFIWYLEGNNRLKPEWRHIIADRKNDVFVSITSPWEMSLKAKKLHLQLPFDSYFRNFEYMLLTITLPHIDELRKLPFHHKDPFDRMLVAQARVEGCMLITLDKKMLAYDVPIL
ncbi:type II toxin-antitoxin system VapC family toxin [Candidatus Gottesmanbacteria bacterium]|nr:type II toxin-antitoxin system VapC family toxin [Candidatus Gottesmanbacteria bacterium]